jgi:hypothetical protein
MTTITLEVPDELAAQLASRREQLPKLLSLALELVATEPPLAAPASPVSHLVFEEMLDFLASGPTPEQITAFKISPSAQERLEELLDKNREQGLTGKEAAELDVYEQVNHVFLLLKARARLALSSAN